MTRRGAATAGGFAAFGAILLVWLLGGGIFQGAPIEAVRVASIAPAQLPPTVTLPAQIFERLPVTEHILELPIAANRYGADRFFEVVPLPGGSGGADAVRVAYTLDTELTHDVFRVLRNGRVALGHVLLLDPATGRVIAYASTDIEQFPPTRTYPAASLVKIITAAAALDRDPALARLPCRYQGSPYRLTRTRIDPPKSGREVSLGRALSSSNNQCFAQLAVHAVGRVPLIDAISRFGWLSTPAPAHAAGSAELGEDRYEVGRLGCGLAGCRITPLHAVQLASTLARGELVTPRWVESIHDSTGREIPILAAPPPRQVMAAELAEEIRAMLVSTTVEGTARRAFRTRGGNPLLGPIAVAGKTGSLTGTDPKGRYEWFVGIAPADEPRIAVAVLLVQSDLWWRNASQIGAEVLQRVFCRSGSCRPELVTRWLRAPVSTAAWTPQVNPAGG